MMVKTSGRVLALALAGMAAIGAAQADETWRGQVGTLVYERDVDGYMAVISYPVWGTEARGEAFIEGMTGFYPREGSLEGIWIEADSAEGQLCTVRIAHPETGEPVGTWGRVRMVFTDPVLPNGLVMQRGDCFAEPYTNEPALSNLGE